MLDEGTVIEVDEDDCFRCPGCGGTVAIFFDRDPEGDIAVDVNGRVVTNVIHHTPACKWITTGGGGEVRGWLEGLLDEAEAKVQLMN